MPPLKTYPKKRLSIIIEKPFMNRLLNILEDQDVPGYTALPVLAGKGKSGSWTRDTQSSEAGVMVQVLVVIDEDNIPAILDAMRAVLDRQIGILTLSDVEVLRPDHF